MRKPVSGAEVQIDGFFGIDHLFEHADLGLVLDVADGERADADGTVRSFDRNAVVLNADAFDAERRNGVHVGDDFEILGRLELLETEDLTS